MSSVQKYQRLSHANPVINYELFCNCVYKQNPDADIRYSKTPFWSLKTVYSAATQSWSTLESKVNYNIFESCKFARLPRLMHWNRFWAVQLSFQTLFTSAAQKAWSDCCFSKPVPRRAICLTEQSVYVLLQELIWTQCWFILVDNTNSTPSLFQKSSSYSYMIKNRERMVCIFPLIPFTFLSSILFIIYCF